MKKRKCKQDFFSHLHKLKLCEQSTDLYGGLVAKTTGWEGGRWGGGGVMQFLYGKYAKPLDGEVTSRQKNT
jgi:hypothetical protein